MKIGEYESHPAAAAFPLMQGDEYKALVADVKANGLRHPIVLFEERGHGCDDLILDGRNRMRACVDLGIKPETKVYEGDDPVGFVISVNLSRRHLSESQRALVAARLATMTAGENQHSRSRKSAGPSQAEAAAMLNVGERTVNAARSVLRDAEPEVVEAVDRGDLAISAAAEVAKLEPEQQREIAAELTKPDATSPRDIIRRTRGDVQQIASRAIAFSPDEVVALRSLMHAGDASKIVEAKEGAKLLRRIVPGLNT